MKNLRKTLKTLLLAGTAALLMSGAALAAELTDISSHWGKEFIDYGVKSGYINGYQDNTFKPNNPVTRAEFSKMVNVALGVTKKASISNFKDIKGADWFYDEVGKAVYLGYISGYEDNTFRANNQITRQEAAVILSRIATRPESDKSITRFGDYASIDTWARDGITFAYSKGFMTGDQAGKINPKNTLTRAEAAKLIYLLKTGENVRVGEYKVTLEEAVCSETIFLDGIVFEPTKAKSSLALDGCKVFGSVTVNGKKDAEPQITIKDSKISELVLSGTGASVTASNDSKIDYVTVESPSTLEGEEYGIIYLNGTDLSSGTTSVNAEAEKIVVMSDAVVKIDETDNLEVSKKTSLTIQTGTIENMTVASAAKGSAITLSSTVTVNNLTVNAACDFMGTGKIKKATNNVSGVTYDTKPEKLTDVNDDDDDTTAGTLAPSSTSPKKDATNVDITSNIILNFGKAIYNESGKTLTSVYLVDCIEVRRSSTSGSKISFYPTLTNSGKSITINPDSILSDDSTYYVILKAGTITDKDGNENDKFTYKFKTGEEEDEDEDTTVTGSITFTPKRGEKDVETDDDIRISFPEAVYKKGGSTLTSSYVESTAITIKEGSSKGDEVDFAADISSTKKTITLEPTDPLKPDTKYYVYINSKTLEYKSGSSVSATSTYFTTDDSLNIKITPANGSTGISINPEIEIEFNTNVVTSDESNITASYLKKYITIKDGTSSNSTEYDYDAKILSDRRTVQIILRDSLETNKRYYITVPSGIVQTDSGAENTKTTAYFTTVADMTPAITPKDDETEVAIDDAITIEFAEAIYTTSSSSTRKEVTAEFLKEKSAITFKQGTSSSSKTDVDFDIVVEGETIIKIIPKSQLKLEKSYYLAFKKGVVYNAKGKSNVAATSVFSTGGTDEIDFIPYDGEKDVEVDTEIDITFGREMFQIGGDELTAKYIKSDVVKIYENDDNGEIVDFSAKISGKTITLVPEDDLKGNTSYLVVLRKGTIEDSKGNENERMSFTFTTEDVVSTTVEIAPKSGATGVSVNTKIEISFASPVYKRGGENAADGEYIADRVIEIREGRSSGDDYLIKYTAEVSADNKTITITPEEILKESTTYYVKFISGYLEYSNGTSVSVKNYNFKTSDGRPKIETFKVAADGAGANDVTFEVVSDTDGVAFITLKPKSTSSGAETVIKEAAVAAGETETIKVIGLASNTSYSAEIYIENGDKKSDKKTITTVSTVDPFTMEAGEPDSSSVVVVITAACDGTLTSLTYENKTTGKVEERTGDRGLSAGDELEIEIFDLDADTSYIIKATFVPDNGAEKVISKTITTEEAVEEVVEITDVTITTSTGSEYHPGFREGAANITVSPDNKDDVIESIKVTAESSSETAEFTVVYTINGGAEEDGGLGKSIAAEAGDEVVIEITLTSVEDPEKTDKKTVTVTVA